MGLEESRNSRVVHKYELGLELFWLLTYCIRLGSLYLTFITYFQEVAESVKEDFGSIDILVHSLANGPEVWLIE